MRKTEDAAREPAQAAQFPARDARYAKLVDHYSRYIKSPVLRLKFLNKALKTNPQRGWLEKLPVVGSLPERALLIMELTKVLPPDQPAPLALRVTSLLYRLRYAVYGVSLALALCAGAGLVYVAGKVISSFSVATEAREAPQPGRPGAASAAGAEAVASIGAEAGLSPEKIWLAEQGEGYEFYSNGARILTEYETDGPARKYYEFDLESPSGEPESLKVGTTPAGIVYHLSEGDQLPFADRYNSSLQKRSRGLLLYAREKKLYNYVIDRFGRIYRIVRDDQTAHHAGNSIWSNGRKLYINLNPSFLGVCFEGAGNAVGAEGINEAQIYAARALTLVLRARYHIEDANCVTHGLVSVSPAYRLMGHHTDWVAGFPYEALGLSDKRETNLAAISHLGFAYDRNYLAAAGGKTWPGLVRAEAALRASAGKNGLTAEAQRQALYQVYQQLYALQRGIDDDAVAVAEK
ncbi:MAG TPA: peptidoglycan recognition family protein [Blastocatellia bacterium]|nr:peptidoglycan recognition family protein [Blastocatellia bacterium]